MKNELKFVEKAFEGRKIRSIWNSNEEKFYISVIDIVSVLTDNEYQIARNYWKVLKNRLKKEGNETVTNCNQLKLLSQDGKNRMTDVVDIEGMFRLIESIPSKRAEPIKLWINQRLKSIDARKEFTDELKNKGIESSKDFAILTNILTSVWSGYSIKEYKELKNLKKENLRDNMTNMELVLNMLAEVSSTEISKSSNDLGYNSVKKSIVKGGNVAKTAKEQIEKETGKKIVSSSNNKNIKQIGNN